MSVIKPPSHDPSASRPEPPALPGAEETFKRMALRQGIIFALITFAGVAAILPIVVSGGLTHFFWPKSPGDSWLPSAICGAVTVMLAGLWVRFFPSLKKSLKTVCPYCGGKARIQESSPDAYDLVCTRCGQRADTTLRMTIGD